MDGRMFDGIGTVMIFGIVFICLLAIGIVIGLPVALWWAYNHLTILVS